MDVIALIGRILFGAIFLFSAMGHLTATEAMAGYAQSKKIPQPKLAVQVSGVWIGLFGALLILGIVPDLAALALLPFLLMTAFLFHNFWGETEAQAKTQEQIQFMKDLALAGGALALLALYGAEDAPGIVLVGGVFSF